MRSPAPKPITTTPEVDAHLAIAAALAKSEQEQRDALDARFQAMLSLPPIAAPSPTGGEAAMPSGGTDTQTSRWRQMEWREGGEDRGGLVTAD